jgi:23S rRNA (guanosine2251-2'-O)-methyltransferase
MADFYKKGGKKPYGDRNRNGNDRLKKEKPYRNDRRRDEEEREPLNNGSVPGRNAVRELLKSGRAIEKIFVQKGEREGSITLLAAEALSKNISLIEVERAKRAALC